MTKIKGVDFQKRGPVVSAPGMKGLTTVYGVEALELRAIFDNDRRVSIDIPFGGNRECVAHSLRSLADAILRDEALR